MKRLHKPRFLSLSLFLLALLLATGCGFYIAATPASAQSGPGQQAINIAAAQPDIAAALDHFPNWSASAEEEDADENTWHVTFYQDQAKEEWLGEALVDLDDESVIDYYIPIFLSPEEEARQKVEVEALVLADAQMLALLGDPDDWDHYTGYDPWEALWRMEFYHGLDAWMAVVNKDEQDRWIIDQIIDPYAFNADEKQRLDRDKAIELAAESNQVWQVLDGIDDWSALASPLTDNQWGVSVITKGHEIYYLRVDIVAWEILEESVVANTKATYLPYHVRH